MILPRKNVLIRFPKIANPLNSTIKPKLPINTFSLPESQCAGENAGPIRGTKFNH